MTVYEVVEGKKPVAVVTIEGGYGCKRCPFMLGVVSLSCEPPAGLRPGKVTYSGEPPRDCPLRNVDVRVQLAEDVNVELRLAPAKPPR